MDHKPFHPEAALRKMWNTINNICCGLWILAAIVAWLLGLEFFLCLFALVGYLLFIYLPVAVYIPAFFRTLEYHLGADSILLKKGVFWRRHTTVPYTKITNIDITQGPVERMYKISKLHLQTAGTGGGETGKAEIVIPGIRDCEPLKEHIAQRSRTALGVPTSAPPPPANDTLGSILAELQGLREDLRKTQG